MSIRRVRIYKGNAEETDVIGFSASAGGAPEDPLFSEFMASRGYDWQEAAERPEGSVSYRHIEVRPPLSDEHLKEFGKICVGRPVHNMSGSGIVDPYHDGIRC